MKFNSLGSVQKLQASGFKQKRKGETLMHFEAVLSTDRIRGLKGKIFVVLVIFSSYPLIKK